MKRVSLWIPAFTMLLVSLISYVDRNTLALLAPTILRETGLTAEQYGFVISAFSIAYMIGNPLWGRLLDRFGLRGGMSVAVGLWSLASASHALASGFASFAAARAALGLGEGATFPGGLRTAVQTLPPHLRARGIAVAYSGGSMGAVLTPLIITPVAAHFGWRAAFLFTGLAGGCWLALWAFVSRRPGIGRHPAPSTPASFAQPAPGPRWNDGRLWSFLAAYAFCALPLAFVIYGAPLFLSRVFGASQAKIGALIWIPPLGWEAGYFFWGWLADRFAGGDAGGMAAFRRMMAAALVLGLPLALLTRMPSLWMVMALLFLAMFVAGGFVILSVSYATSVFSSGHAGLIAGLGAGAWSAAVAVVMPVFGHLFDQGRWEEACWLAAGIPVLGFAIWRAFHERGGLRAA